MISQAMTYIAQVIRVMSRPTWKALPKPIEPPATLSRYERTPKKTSRNDRTMAL